jgi:hypothetical protein
LGIENILKTEFSLAEQIDKNHFFLILHPFNALRSLTASLIVIQSGIPSLMFRQVGLSDIIHLLSHNDIADEFRCVFERCLKFIDMK